MMRRLIAAVTGILLISVLAAGTAAANHTDGDPDQHQSPQTIVTVTTTTTTTTTPSTTSTSVLPGEETTTTTTTEAPTTTEEPTTTTAAPTTEAPAVSGDVVSRPLPRTGNDIGGTALFGGALTILGVALALGARKRRNSFDGV